MLKLIIKFRTFSKLDWMFICSTVFSLFPLFLSFVIDGFAISNGFFISLGVLLLSNSIFDVLRASHSDAIIKSEISKLNSSSELVYFPEKRDAIRELAAFPYHIRNVYNTHIDSLAESTYTEEDYTTFVEFLKRALDKGASVSDVIGRSTDSKFVDGHYELAQELKENKNYKRYRAFKRTGRHPHVNFILIDYIDDREGPKRRVYFGWGGLSTDLDSVFCSENEALIAVFSKVHTGLREGSTAL